MKTIGACLMCTSWHHNAGSCKTRSKSSCPQLLKGIVCGGDHHRLLHDVDCSSSVRSHTSRASLSSNSSVQDLTEIYSAVGVSGNVGVRDSSSVALADSQLDRVSNHSTQAITVDYLKRSIEDDIQKELQVKLVSQICSKLDNSAVQEQISKVDSAVELVKGEMLELKDLVRNFLHVSFNKAQERVESSEVRLMIAINYLVSRIDNVDTKLRESNDSQSSRNKKTKLPQNCSQIGVIKDQIDSSKLVARAVLDCGPNDNSIISLRSQNSKGIRKMQNRIDVTPYLSGRSLLNVNSTPALHRFDQYGVSSVDFLPVDFVHKHSQILSCTLEEIGLIAALQYGQQYLRLQVHRIMDSVHQFPMSWIFASGDLFYRIFLPYIRAANLRSPGLLKSVSSGCLQGEISMVKPLEFAQDYSRSFSAITVDVTILDKSVLASVLKEPYYMPIENTKFKVGCEIVIIYGYKINYFSTTIYTLPLHNTIMEADLLQDKAVNMFKLCEDKEDIIQNSHDTINGLDYRPNMEIISSGECLKEALLDWKEKQHFAQLDLKCKLASSLLTNGMGSTFDQVSETKSRELIAVFSWESIIYVETDMKTVFSNSSDQVLSPEHDSLDKGNIKNQVGHSSSGSNWNRAELVETWDLIDSSSSSEDAVNFPFDLSPDTSRRGSEEVLGWGNWSMEWLLGHFVKTSARGNIIVV